MNEPRKLPMHSIVRAIRGTVCPICYQRPHGSDMLPNHIARSCEGGCPIFFHLPALYRIAVPHNNSEPGTLEAAVRSTICQPMLPGSQCGGAVRRICQPHVPAEPILRGGCHAD